MPRDCHRACGMGMVYDCEQAGVLRETGTATGLPPACGVGIVQDCEHAGVLRGDGDLQEGSKLAQNDPDQTHELCTGDACRRAPSWHKAAFALPLHWRCLQAGPKCVQEGSKLAQGCFCTTFALEMLAGGPQMRAGGLL
jgi:hypothetical protein